VKVVRWIVLAGVVSLLASCGWTLFQSADREQPPPRIHHPKVSTRPSGVLYYNGKLYRSCHRGGKLRPCAFLPGTKIHGKLAGAMVEFFTQGTNGANCEIDVAPYVGPVTQVYCLSGLSRPDGSFREHTAICATLSKSGRLRISHLGPNCSVGNAYLGAPTVRYGQSIPFGPFRCTALRAGTRCIVKKTGLGFLLTNRHGERVIHG
jgi:hypothetical protein